MTLGKGGGRHLFLSVRRDGQAPLAEQIATGIREAVERGALATGDRLPSSRGLALEVGVARNTVVAAYLRLQAEGYLESRPGGSVRVAARAAQAPRLVAAPEARRPPSPLLPAPHLAPLVAMVTERPPLVRAGSVPRAFRPSVPAMDLFPVELWGRLLSRTWRRASLQMLGYGDAMGFRPLRESVVRHLRAGRGIACEVDQVMITQGSLQALEFAARVLVSPGDVAWVEDPGFLWGRGALVAAGARIQAVPVDGEGMTVPRLPAARVALVTPARQLPLGVQMSLARRRQLLATAAASGMAIIEDDYDAAFSFADEPLPPLAALDRRGLVLHAGTFSKQLYPALRLGYLVLPPELVDAASALRHASDFHPPILEQATLEAFIREGHLDRHLRRMRTRYQDRYRLLADRLQARAAGLLELQVATGGMNVIAWLPPGTSDTACAWLLAEAGVDVLPVSSMTIERELRPGLLLGFGGLREDEIIAGVDALVAALHRQPLPRRVGEPRRDPATRARGSA